MWCSNFEDYETALACYNSPEYQAEHQAAAPHSRADLVSSKATTARSLSRLHVFRHSSVQTAAFLDAAASSLIGCRNGLPRLYGKGVKR